MDEFAVLTLEVEEDGPHGVAHIRLENVRSVLPRNTQRPRRGLSLSDVTQGTACILHEQDQVQRIRWTRLKLWDEVQIEVACVLALGMDEQASAADGLVERYKPTDDVRQQSRSEVATLVVGIDAQACSLHSTPCPWRRRSRGPGVMGNGPVGSPDV